MSSSPAPPAASSPTLTHADLPSQLGDLRAEIDRIDDGLHDLLMRRAAVVARVAELRAIGKVPFRPGREAAIIRRLLARHTGRLPPRAIVRLWREMFAANIAIESSFVIAACERGPGDAIVQTAREQFGSLTPLRAFASPEAAINEVRTGRATVAVLPAPDDEVFWWTMLLNGDEPRPQVVARLPFLASPRPEGAVCVSALVIALAAADPSGSDRTLIAADPRLGAEAMASSVVSIAPSGWALHDVAGFLQSDDRSVVLGHYAVPIGSTAP